MNRQRALYCVAGTILLVLAGCAPLARWKDNGFKVGPNYFRTQPTVGTDYEENSPNIINQVHAVEDREWWRVFEDPEIDRLVELANAQNLPLKVAFLRIQEQRYQRSIDQGNLWPQEQAAFTEFQRAQFSKTGNQFGILGQGNPFSLYRVGVNANWEIDVWGRLRRIVEASDATLQATEDDYCDVKLSLIADIVAAYTEIRLYQQRLSIAHDQTKAQTSTLEIAKRKFEEGDVSSLDVSQAEATLNNTFATIPVLQNQLTQANNRLCLLLGRPPSNLYAEHYAFVPTAPRAVTVGMPRDLVRRRPDVRAAERRLAAQSARIGVAEADLYPALRLRGTIGFDSFKVEDLINGDSVSGAIVPGVQWNLLNYGRIKNHVRVQTSRYHQLLATYRQVVLSANNEASNAISAYARKLDEVNYLVKAATNTEEALSVAQTQYEEGEVEFDTVNALLKDLIRQQDQVAVARGEVTLELIRLYKAMGGGWKVAEDDFSQFCQQVSLGS